MPYLNSIFSTKSNILFIILDKGPNLDDNALKLIISSWVKNLTSINAKKYTIIQTIIPTNNQEVVLGIIYATTPIIIEAANILTTETLGALTLVNLNTI